MQQQIEKHVTQLLIQSKHRIDIRQYVNSSLILDCIQSENKCTTYQYIDELAGHWCQIRLKVNLMKLI